MMNPQGNIMATVTAYFGMTDAEWNQLSDYDRQIKYQDFQSKTNYDVNQTDELKKDLVGAGIEIDTSIFDNILDVFQDKKVNKNQSQFNINKNNNTNTNTNNTNANPQTHAPNPNPSSAGTATTVPITFNSTN